MGRLYLFILLLPFVFISCNQNSTGDVENTVEEINDNIMGTWKMVSYKHEDDTIFVDVPSFLFYRKFITPTHFSWISYGDEGDNIYGAGGGTYSYTGDKYTENIEYFFPPGSNLPGTTVTFNSEIKGKRWRIYGYVRSVSIDPLSGDYAQADSTWLEEVWENIN